ncbi:hypothetical protein [Streptomyces meridianus]|nr:hypothetical protein [Streptomyces meridianus]
MASWAGSRIRRAVNVVSEQAPAYLPPGVDGLANLDQEISDL